MDGSQLQELHVSQGKSVRFLIFFHLVTPWHRLPFRTQVGELVDPAPAWETSSYPPSPRGPGFLLHHQPLLLFPSEPLQNILTHPLTQVVYFCSHNLLPHGLEIIAVMSVHVCLCVLL